MSDTEKLEAMRHFVRVCVELEVSERTRAHDIELATLRAELGAVRSQLETATRSVYVDPLAAKSEPAAPGERGADGRGILTTLIRDGHLIVFYTDGTEQDAGRVVGQDGARGADGAPGERGERGEPGERGEAGAMGERGADGAPGRDGERGERGERGEPGQVGERGADGIVTRDELEAIVEERFRDVQARSLADTYRDVYRNGEDYTRGDIVTYNGSLWLALANTTGAPESSLDWKLVAKRGRDGRDRVSAR